MKNKLFGFLSALLLLSLMACEKDENIDPPPPPPTNRIDYLLVEELKEELRIYGKFPDQKGTVTLGNLSLPIKVWSGNLIICAVPYEDLTNYGDVVVRSSDTQSAPRRLYKWVIEFSSIRPHGGIAGEILEEAHGEVAIRGDIHPVPAAVFTADCTELFLAGECYYSAGGTTSSSYDCGTMTAEWTPVQDVFYKSLEMRNLAGKTHFQGYKNFAPNGFDLYLDFLAWELIPIRVTTYPCNGPSFFSEKKWSSQLIGLDGYDAIPLRFQAGTHNIQSDSIMEDVYCSSQLIWNVEDGDTYKRTAKLTWKSTVYPEE